MYDATALTTPAPAKGPNFRAFYEPLTSTSMLNLATNQAGLLVITCFMLSSAIMGLIHSKCVGARSISSLRSLTCSLMPLLCNAIRWLRLMRWFSRRRSSSATLVWSSTSLELAFDGVLATILLAPPCFFSVPLMLEKKFSRLNASSSPTG